MAKLTIDFRRGFLKRLARAASQSAQTLERTINVVLDATGDNIATGTVLIEASGNGSSVTFQLPEDLSPAAIFELCSQLDDLRSESVSELATENIETPTQAQILERMLLLLRPRTERRTSYANMPSYA